MDDGAVNELIGGVYDASYGRARWPTYLESLRVATGSITTSLVDADLSGVSADGLLGPFVSAEANQLYQDYYCRHDEYGLACMHHGIGPGQTWSSHALIPDEQLAATEFHDGWLRKFDYFYTAGSILFVDGSSIIGLGIIRNRKMGAPDATTIRLLEALAPHHQRAYLIERRLRQLEANRQFSETYADALPYGLIAIDRRGRVLSMNRMSKSIADARDGFTLGPTSLAALRPREDGVLQRAVAAALAANPSGSTVYLPRPSSLKPLVLLITPVPRDFESRFGLGDEIPAVLIIVHDTERKTPSQTGILRTLYDLTPQQARLASLLGTGASLSEAAEQLGVTRGTANSHLKQIFRKTGVRRQSALVHLLMSLPSDTYDA